MAGGITLDSKLIALRTGMHANFLNGLGSRPTIYEQLCTIITSTTAKEMYSGFNSLSAGMRLWTGDREIKGFREYSYEVSNQTFETTFGVFREHIEDDILGMYSTMSQQMGIDATLHPDKLLFQLIKTGTSALGYDGVPFFSTTHPLFGGATQSNYISGGPTPFYIAAMGGSFKPFIFQWRKRPEFVQKDKPTDDNVFMRGDYYYGVDMRCAAGFLLPQLCVRCDKALSVDSYGEAYEMLQNMKTYQGDPGNAMPTHLIVPPSLQRKAREILNSENIIEQPGNVLAYNPWQGTTTLVVAPYLA